MYLILEISEEESSLGAANLIYLYIPPTTTTKDSIKFLQPFYVTHNGNQLNLHFM